VFERKQGVEIALKLEGSRSYGFSGCIAAKRSILTSRIPSRLLGRAFARAMSFLRKAGEPRKSPIFKNGLRRWTKLEHWNARLMFRFVPLAPQTTPTSKGHCCFLLSSQLQSSQLSQPCSCYLWSRGTHHGREGQNGVCQNRQKSAPGMTVA
jgi:hypothetical protein